MTEARGDYTIRHLTEQPRTAECPNCHYVFGRIIRKLARDGNGCKRVMETLSIPGMAGIVQLVVPCPDCGEIFRYFGGER